MSGYKGYTEAGARAYKKYVSKLSDVRLRMLPEERAEIEAAAAAAGQSINKFVTDAALDRARKKK